MARGGINVSAASLNFLKQYLKHTDTQEAFLEGYVLKYRESGGRKF